MRRLHEGARPDPDLLALVAGVSPAHVRKRAVAEGWTEPPKVADLRARLPVLVARAVAMLDDLPDAPGDNRARLDDVTAILRVAEKLKDALKAAEAEPSGATEADETDIADAFARIDNRISELAHALAERLVEEKPDAPAGGTGPKGVAD